MLDGQDLVDVTLACEERKQFQAHKFFLKASSSFFKEILRKNKFSHITNFPWLKKQLNNLLMWVMEAKEDVTLLWKNGQEMDGHVVIVALSIVYIKQCRFQINLQL